MMTVNPQSLFGKYPYLHEQRMIVNFTKEIDRTVVLVSPRTVGMLGISYYAESNETKRKKIKEHLTRARDILSEMGV